MLDVGCNTGSGTMRFLPVSNQVVGVDVSPRAIAAARQRASAGRPEFVKSGGFDLPFPEASLDLLTSFQMLEHPGSGRRPARTRQGPAAGRQAV